MTNNYKLVSIDCPEATYRELIFKLSPTDSLDSLFKVAASIFPDISGKLFAIEYSYNGELKLRRGFEGSFCVESMYKGSKKNEYLTAVVKNEFLLSLKSYCNDVTLGADPRRYMHKAIYYVIGLSKRLRKKR